MKLRQPTLWVLLVLIGVGLIEASLRLVFFQLHESYPLAMVQAYHTAKDLVDSRRPPKRVGIWTRDGQFGFAHIANTTGTHESLDFLVKYSIGGDKERWIPAPDSSAGKVLFLGDSYTFGQGVGDDQNFPYILSTVWREWHIVNKAVMGWGTAQAYLTVLQEMKRDDPPAVVIYTMIPDAIRRNYIRKSWVATIAKYGYDHPHFELVGGKPVFQGVVGEANSVEDSEEMRDKEIALSQAYLVEMQAVCKEKHVPFIVVLLENGLPYAVMKTLAENDVQVVDLTDLGIKGFARDRHPNPGDHRRIAEALHRSFVSDLLETVKRSRRSLKD